ncbi:unnamed protein product [Parnassius mnemosyne]|uniref:Uncharacterized protein n=1 Tax=Parnassius mnemosyne TaxID=213953 RepID=A0AAV1M149_9NEOP
MNILRSPTRSDMRDTLSDSQLNESNIITFRNKRKLPEDNDDITVIKKEVCELTNKMSQIMSMLTTICTNQKEFMEKISSDVADLKKEINDMKLTINHVNTENEIIKTDISNLLEKNKNSEQKICHLESEIKSFKITTGTSSLSYGTEKIMAEISEREQRSKNIVIIGISENAALDKEHRTEFDKGEVIKILKTIDATCPLPKKILRLGKYTSGKHRPIKIFFESQDVVKFLLKNKTKLNDDTIRLYSDQTPQQKLYLKELTQELNDRIKKGEENISIKYSKNVPRIVKSVSKNSKQ